MSVTDGTLPLTPSADLLSADRARRRMVVRGVSALQCAFSVLASIMMLFTSPPSLTWWATLGAAVPFGVAWWLARNDAHAGLAAAVLLGGMQAQHVIAALALTELGEITSTIMFSGLIPLVAAASVRTRGTILATVVALLAVSLVFWFELQRGIDPQSAGRTVGAPLFFVLVAGVVAISSSFASHLALLAQTAQQQARHQAEAAAAEAERKLRLIADQVTDLVAILDAAGRYTFASASYERILDLKPEGLLGHTAIALIHSDDVEPTTQAFLEATQLQAREVVTRLRTRDGTHRVFHIRMLGVEIEGKPHVAVTARDITSLQISTAEVESARRMDALGRLAGGVAHDFNNLLSVVASCAGMVQAKLPQDHEAVRDVQLIEEAVQQAASLTGQLLAFARRQILPRGHTTPAAVAQRMAALLQSAVGEKVHVELDTSASNWTANMSDGQLEQILMNLAVNARDAMPGGGPLRIRVADRNLQAGEVAGLSAGDHITLEVSDTGTGMPPEVCARVFEPFFTTKGPGRGTGLGLATSFGIARQAGGTLTVESQAGQGATFRLYLPRSLEDAVAPHASIPTPQARTANLKVLVLDDEQRICDLIRRLLEMAGHHAVVASAAQEALGRAREQPFDAILTDVVLGREDGLDVLVQLRALQPGARAVVMSGFTPSPERLTALRETGIGFLAKPFSAESLLQVVTAPAAPTSHR